MLLQDRMFPARLGQVVADGEAGLDGADHQCVYAFLSPVPDVCTKIGVDDLVRGAVAPVSPREVRGTSGESSLLPQP